MSEKKQNFESCKEELQRKKELDYAVEKLDTNSATPDGDAHSGRAGGERVGRDTLEEQEIILQELGLKAETDEYNAVAASGKSTKMAGDNIRSKMTGDSLRTKISAITWPTVVSYVWLAGIMILYWVFYAKNITGLLDSDMSSEMVLGKLVSGGNGVLSRNWFYSTEIRVLNNQIIFGLLFHIFGSWHRVRVASAIVLSLVMLASFFYLCRELGIQKYFPYAASFLFLPFSVIYSDIVLMGLYYIPHIVISFLTIAMILHLDRMFYESRLKYFWLVEVLLALLSLLAGMGGPRQLIILYLPLVLTSLYRTYQEKHFRYHGIYTALVFSGIGYLLNARVLSKYFSFNTWTELNFQNFSLEYVQRLISGILNSFGYTSGEIFSDALIRNVACFAIVIAIVLYYIYYFRHGKNLPSSERLLAIFFLMNLLVYFLLYNFTDMSYEDRYALPIIIFAIPLLVQVFRNHHWRKSTAITIGGIAGVLVFLSSVSVYRYQAGIDYNNERQQLAAALVADGYCAGYATYWNGNIMTELSDGALEMYTWKKGATEQIDVDDLFLWLQKVDHATNPPQGKIFLMLSAEEKSVCPFLRYLTDENKIYESDAYVIYGFVDYESMRSILSTYTYDMVGDASWMSAGETVTLTEYAGVSGDGAGAGDGSTGNAVGEAGDGTTGTEDLAGGSLDATGEAGDGVVAGVTEHVAWILAPGCVTKGPNITMYSGVYYLTITGENLDYISVMGTTDFGEGNLNIELLQSGNTLQIYEIYLEQNAIHCEFPIINGGAESVRIDSVQILRGQL